MSRKPRVDEVLELTESLSEVELRQMLSALERKLPEPSRHRASGDTRRPDQAPTLDLVGLRLGNVRIEQSLGRGGMGEVFRGFDDKLERPVAIKTMRAEHRLLPSGIARFRREARLLSKLNHPAICQVYELIERPEADYLVMELIEGETLKKRLEQPLEQTSALAIAERIVEALAVAHSRGIVHRDLKPDNVMLTTSGEVKVLDFGIARSVDDTAPRVAGASPDRVAAVDETLTHQGEVLGTLPYMSPEQAGGEPVTAASDVFSLGLIFHELFGGRPAYPRSSSKTRLRQDVLRGATATVRDLEPEIAELLAGMTARLPEQRPSAREVCRRVGFIRGAPERRRRALLRAATISFLILLLVASSGLVLRERLQARASGRLARDFGEAVAQVQSEWTISRLLPAHETEADDLRLASRRHEIERRMQQLGDIARGPGLEALGRLDLVLGDPGSALDKLEASRQAGNRRPSLVVALAEASAELYRQEAKRLRRALGAEAREERRQRLEPLRQRTLAYLEDALRGDAGEGALLRARIAWIEDRMEEAEAKALEVTAGHPDHFEAWSLAGSARGSLGRQQLDRGDRQQAARSFELALEHFSRSVHIARSYGTALKGICETRLKQERLGPHGPGDGGAFAACDDALRVTPRDPDLLTTIGWGWWHRAEAAIRAGEDPAVPWQRILEAADLALESSATDPAAWRLRGLVQTQQAMTSFRSGRDTEPRLEDAQASLERSLHLLPINTYCWIDLGNIGLFRAEAKMARLADPSEDLGAALAAFDKAAELDAGTLSLWSNRGIVGWYQAAWDLEHGADPSPSLDLAERDFARALELAPSFYALANLGDAHRLRARWLLLSGRNPAREVAKAIDHYRRSAEIQERYAKVWVYAAESRLIDVHWALGSGDQQAARRQVAAALLDLEQALRRRDDDVEAYRVEARAHRLGARLAPDPGPLRRRAEKALERAREANPNDAESHLERSRLHLELGRVDRALEAITSALELRPEWGEGLLHRARVHLAAGEPAAACRDHDRALEIDANQARLARDLPCRDAATTQGSG